MKDKNWPHKAVILAAGRGRRLRPYTDHTPKPLLPVNNQPLLDFTLQAAAHAGVTQVVLVTHYLAEQIQAFVGNGTRWGLDVTFRYQHTMNGTAQALHTAVDFIDEPLFVLAADYILPLDYLQTLKTFYHQYSESHRIAISLKHLSAADQTKSSSVRYDTNGRIAEIVEKPTAEAVVSNHAASLIYIVPAAIKQYLQTLELSSRGEYELPTVLNRMISAGFPARGLLQNKPAEWQPHMWSSISN